jgi:hypothetical protein
MALRNQSKSAYQDPDPQRTKPGLLGIGHDQVRTTAKRAAWTLNCLKLGVCCREPSERGAAQLLLAPDRGPWCATRLEGVLASFVSGFTQGTVGVGPDTFTYANVNRTVALLSERLFRAAVLAGSYADRPGHSGYRLELIWAADAATLQDDFADLDDRGDIRVVGDV